MARIRSIKPEFWTDEKVVESSPLARLLFIGLWNFADDEGRMVYSPTRIKLQILPADKCDIRALIDELQKHGMVMIYKANEAEYLAITNFSQHQKIDKRTSSRLPEPPRVTPNPSESPRIPTTDQGRDQGRDQGVEGIKEGSGSRKGREETPVAALPLPAGLKPETWNAYVKTRPARARKPESLKAALEKLEGFRVAGYDPEEIVANSLANGWQMLKEPDARRPGATPPDYSSLVNQ